MTPEQIDLWLKIMTSVLSIGAVVVAVFGARRKAINERLEAGSKRMDALDTAVAAMQAQLQHMPSRDDVHRIEIAMLEVAGTVKELAAHTQARADQMAQLKELLTIQHEHLLNKDKRA